LINDSKGAIDTTSEDFKSPAEKFSLVHTPSNINSANLRSALEALAYNVQVGIFDTLTKAYILKESTLITQYKTLCIIREKHLDGIYEINKKRRIIQQGKYMLLKNQTVITTKRLYEQVKVCKKATEKKRTAKGRTKRRSGLQAALNNANDVQSKDKAQDVVILDEIVVL